MATLLSFGGVMTYIFYIVIALGILLFLVMVHEFGHYTAGKLLGFKIDEFSIGFGPKIFQKKKKNGELFTLRTIPLGGYCAFDGEDLDSNSPTAFNNQKPWKRLIVLVSGVLFNFLTAVIFSFILLTCFGYERVEVKHIDSTSYNYSEQVTIEGYNYGLREGDMIYGVDGEKFDFVHDKYFNKLALEYIESIDFETYEQDGKTRGTIPMNVRRDGEYIVVDVVVEKVVDGEDVSWAFATGEELQLDSYKSSFTEALGECWTFSFRWCHKIFIILGDLFTGGVPIKDLGGPVTTIKVMADTTSQDWSFIFILIPVIAVNLAVFNILPIPSLDGARCVFVIIEWIRRKPINRDLEGKIHTFGLFALLGLVVIVDILHFIL